MSRHSKFLTETPRKVKTSSIPRQVHSFDSESLKEAFRSELGSSIFDENKLPSTYNGDIIADCWLPDGVLRVTPSADLLSVLKDSDGKPLYDFSNKEWSSQHLPPILRKGSQRTRGHNDEQDLSGFLTVVMDALENHLSSAIGPLDPPSNDSDPGPPHTFAPTTSVPIDNSSSPSALVTDSDPTSDFTPTSSISDSFTPPPSASLGTTSVPDSLACSPSAEVPVTDPTSDFTPTSESSISDSLPPPPSAPSSTSSTRYWSSAAATRPLAGGLVKFKPDSVLVRRPAVEGATKALEWADVLMTAELTSRKESVDLIAQIECKVLAIFDAQPNRAFCYSLSFHNGQYCLRMYDRSGGVYSRSYDLHESPLPLLRILCAATSAQFSHLGTDDTFDCRLHPIIHVDDQPYLVLAKCFSRSVIRGRATSVWFASKSIPAGNDPKDVVVIKDSWVNADREFLEEDILETLKDVECVPKVVKGWTVQRHEKADSTSLRRPETFMSQFNRPCDRRVHRRLVLTPAGRPITHAATPLEVATCLLDLVIAHKEMWRLGVLHRDISINNAMVYEEVLPDGTCRVRGLLIDFDYAIKGDSENRRIGPGDRTGTLPFMAIEVLRAGDNRSVQHEPAHDLESFVYLLCWIIIMFDGPESHLSTADNALGGWYIGKDLRALANNKQGCISSATHLEDVTPYYECLVSCARALCKCVDNQLDYKKRSSLIDDDVEYLVGTKRRRSDSEEGDADEPLNHDAIIKILHRTCLLLAQQEEPENLLQPFILTKGKYYRAERSDMILDLGGAPQSKKRRITRRMRGPAIQTAVS